MEEDDRGNLYPFPLGTVEPNAALLDIPPGTQLLYKLMTVENLSRSIVGSYLHFNRVDRYGDFPGADPHDGEQVARDRAGNVGVRFERAPDFSAADYYDRSRARTFACCFSLENSAYIWKSYANGSPTGKACVIFEFGKLRAMLNAMLGSGTSRLFWKYIQCHQLFSIHYGKVRYIDWNTFQANVKHLPNPAIYTYLKHKRSFEEEQELRISLSAFSLGQMAVAGRVVDFPGSLHLGFDFKKAIADGTVREIVLAPDADAGLLEAAFGK